MTSVTIAPGRTFMNAWLANGASGLGISIRSAPRSRIRSSPEFEMTFHASATNHPLIDIFYIVWSQACSSFVRVKARR